MENYPVELLAVVEPVDAEEPGAALDLPAPDLPALDSPALDVPVLEDPPESLPDESELELFPEIAAESEPADADLPDSRLSLR